MRPVRNQKQMECTTKILCRISGGSCGLYGRNKNVMLFWHMATVTGIGLPNVVMSLSKMSRMDIVEFHPVVGGIVSGATLKASLLCLTSVS